MIEKGRSLSGAVVVLALVISLLAGFLARGRLVEAQREVRHLREQLLSLVLHRNTLLQQLNETELDAPFLAAAEVFGQAQDGFPFERPKDVILYLLSTTCQFSSSNFEFLREARHAGIEVIGLATDSITADVNRYWEEWDPGFPVLVGPHGSAMDLVPQFSTPTLAVISGGRLVSLEFGRLEKESKEAVLAWFKTGPDSD